MTEHTSFQGLGIVPTLLAILDKAKYTTPTPIQVKSIPSAIEGKDVIGIAQTGTGKTLAFGIPMIQRLAQHKGKGLVILPTRELALQVEESLKKLGGGIGMKTACLIGGENIGKQKRQLAMNPHVIIATPGRLIDHLEQRTLKLTEVNILVLDEADRMLDMGFAPQINRILETVPKKRQTLLFSATMPEDIVRIAATHMALPVRIEVAPQGSTSERVSQELIIVEKAMKINLLEKILKETQGTILVFSRTKHGATKICRAVRALKHTAAEIHANRSLNQRKEALEGFRGGRYRILVATDIAARGIDVKGIELVVNYDLPDNAEDYVHRIGRTGRAGQEGKAISFASPDQHSEIRAIERLIRGPLPRTKVEGLSREMPAESFGGGSRGPQRGRGGRSYGGGARSSGGSYGGSKTNRTHRPSTAAPARTGGNVSRPAMRDGVKIDDEDAAPGYRYDPFANRGRGGRGGRR